MQYKGMNLCDFCFEPVAPGTVCNHCGLSHENYKAEAGLLLPGTNLLGKYIIGRVLGRGGFGATYLAYSSERDKVVAIKEYYPTGIANRAKGEEKISIVSDDKRGVFEKGAKRFFEEAKTMSRFNTNKNVISVYEFFYANDTVYYSMEYMEGIDLKGYIAKKGGRLSEAEAVTIMKGVCDALVAVHSTQTLHRDISPDNIFVCTNGTVKLIDFGAAKQVIGDVQQVYSVVVKQGFAPAEQYKSNGKQGVWTDIYAVGASMYYAVTGTVPTDAMNRVENPDIVFDSSLNLSPMFKEIINKCLQSKIEDRYQSAIELLGALGELNVQEVAIGGRDYIQTVYNGVSSSLHGDAVSFGGGNNGAAGVAQTGYNPYANNLSQNPNSQMPNQNVSQFPPSQYSPSQIPQSQFPPSQYPVSGYYQNNGGNENKSMMNGLIIGGGICLVILLLVLLVVTMTTPMGGPGGPPPTPGMPGMPPPSPGDVCQYNRGLPAVLFSLPSLQ